MPDEDRFERLLRGKGWKRSYRLAAGNSPLPVLVDSLVKAAANALRSHVQCPSLARISDALCDSLTREHGQNSSIAVGDTRGFEHLTDVLDEIETEDLGYVGTQLARRAAEKVFVEESRQSGGRKREEVQDRLGEVFIADLVDHQCLSRVRPSVADKNNRNIEEQRAWEQEVQEGLKPQARKLFRSAIKSEDKNAIRAPRRTVTAPPSLEIRLHEPLVPLQR